MFRYMSDPDRAEKVAAMSPEDLAHLMEQGVEVLKYMTGGFSTSPLDAVGDLYVAPPPALGLLRAGAGAEVGAVPAGA